MYNCASLDVCVFIDFAAKYILGSEQRFWVQALTEEFFAKRCKAFERTVGDGMVGVLHQCGELLDTFCQIRI